MSLFKLHSNLSKYSNAFLIKIQEFVAITIKSFHFHKNIHIFNHSLPRKKKFFKLCWGTRSPNNSNYQILRGTRSLVYTRLLENEGQTFEMLF